jgi:eukaryotic-like serine/threonine-protein kinase
LAGKQFKIERHDTLIAGRMPDCKIRIPKSDIAVSRHHFLLEVIPPQVIIRDLGSKNGTWINGDKFGGRRSTENPEQAAKRTYPRIELKDGDVIRIGKTHIQVSVQQSMICVACGEEILESDLPEALQDDGSYLCALCKASLFNQKSDPSSSPHIIRCLNCGKDVTVEVGPYVTGGYLCHKCRELVQKQVIDPFEVLRVMFKEARLEKESELNIPDYEAIKQLGRGGMSVVYLVRHKHTGKKSALKIMDLDVKMKIKNKAHLGNMILTMQELSQHPFIVDLYDGGEVNGFYYFLMEFCEGGNASDLTTASNGKLDLQTTGRIMLQCLEGLAYAHENGYVHGDLKPTNILLTLTGTNGIAKIADMMLTKNFTVDKEYTGILPFTPREQITNFKFLNPVSDVWAMGATIYYLLTNRFPRRFTKYKVPLLCILENDIIPIERIIPTIPRRMAEIINTSLEDNIQNRYQSAREFKEALEDVL